MERCVHCELWLARDGVWRCTVCHPPRFPSEVVERRIREEPLFDPREFDSPRAA